MTNCSHEHAEWIAPGNLMERNFDSHLRIEVMALGSFPKCLYKEAMHLQYFLPTRYVRGRASRTHKRDDLYQNFSKVEYGEPAALCGSTMLHYVGFWTFFFFLLGVWSP